MSKTNAIVGQSGGPTAAINATLAGVIRGALSSKDDIGTLYGMTNGIKGFLREDMINLSEIFADESVTLKRARPRAQGRMYKRFKRTSHLTVKLTKN